MILDASALDREASRLRLLAVGHINNHAAKFSESWDEDPDELPIHRAGAEEPITTFAAYEKAAANKVLGRWFADSSPERTHWVLLRHLELGSP